MIEIFDAPKNFYEEQAEQVNVIKVTIRKNAVL